MEGKQTTAPSEGCEVSYKVMDFVFELPLTPSQKLVALALAAHARHDGTEARPSQALLVDKTGLGERQVRRVTRELLDLGVLRVQRPSAQHRAVCYAFNLGYPERTPMSAQNAPRGDTHVRPEGSSRADIYDSRADICDTQSGHPCPPNREESLFESTQRLAPLPNLDDIKRRNRQIFAIGLQASETEHGVTSEREGSK
jgi:hypothetical protein